MRYTLPLVIYKAPPDPPFRHHSEAIPRSPRTSAYLTKIGSSSLLREAEWQPTKFQYRGDRWRASRDKTQVNPASRLMADRIATAYEAAIRQYAHGTLLDLGCGHVPLYGCYRDLVDKIVCVDWPNTLHPSPHLDIEADLNEPLPLEDQTFDTILLTDVLEHLPHPDSLWREMQRMIRPGGALIVGVPFLYWLHEQPFDHLRYTEHRLRLFCQEHGFDVAHLRPYGGGGDVLIDVLGKVSARLPLLRSIARLMGSIAARRPAPQTTSLPLGYVLVARRR